MGWVRIAPIPTSFFLTSVLGAIITAIYWNFGVLDDSWAFAFMIVFVAMFIASFISMSRADIEAQIAVDPVLRKGKL